MKHPFHLIDLVTFKKVSSLLSGNYKTSFHGSGIEFALLREYSLGDDTADIDWKASARTGKTYIKKYEEDRERKVLFVLDVGRSMSFASGERLKQSTLSDVFSLLLFSSAASHDPSGAWFFTDHIQQVYKIDKGMAHLHRIHEDFHAILEQDAREESSLPIAFQELWKKRIRNHLIFIFSDSLELPEESYIRSIAEQNDCIFIHIFDSFENTLVGTSKHILFPDSDIFLDSLDTKKQAVYVQARALELQDFRHKIVKMGCSYLALDETQDVYKELYLFFKKRQR